ncbi:MAG: hypothetical protein WDM79_01495 [Terricaulis sp.]
MIAEAHVEMRKFERLLELHEERARATAAKREDAELDEVATPAARAALSATLALRFHFPDLPKAKSGIHEHCQ